MFQTNDNELGGAVEGPPATQVAPSIPKNSILWVVFFSYFVNMAHYFENLSTTN